MTRCDPRTGASGRHPVDRRQQRRIVEAGPDVAGNDQCRTRRQQRRRGRDAARRLQRLGLARPADAHMQARAVAECVHERVGAVRGVDDEIGEARATRAPRSARRSAACRRRASSGFGVAVGQRPHALAAAGGEDHRAAAPPLRSSRRRRRGAAPLVQRHRAARAAGRARGSAPRRAADSAARAACRSRRRPCRRGCAVARRCRAP